jgi:hypothetical protein
MPERIPEYMPERMPDRMLEYRSNISNIYFQMVCQKLCPNNGSGWGSLEESNCLDNTLLSNCAQKVFGAKQFQKPFIQKHFIHISLGKAVPFTLGSQIHAES